MSRFSCSVVSELVIVIYDDCLSVDHQHNLRKHSWSLVCGSFGLIGSPIIRLLLLSWRAHQAVPTWGFRCPEEMRKSTRLTSRNTSLMSVLSPKWP